MTRTDDELIALAARAGGIDTAKSWAPLADDGDALRLAVKLGLYIEIYRPSTRASALPEVEDMGFCREAFGADECAATRRAIVRAAAVIGERMP